MAGLLGALLDPQFREDVRTGLLGAVNRGAVGGLLGAPVDLATMALRPFGYAVEKPVGGSEWIGQKMQDAGLVSAQRNPVAEMLASVAIPAAAMRAAPAVFRAEQAIPQAAEKYGMAAERALDPMVTRGLDRGGLVREGLLGMGHGTASRLDDPANAAERAARMAAMEMERGWFRGGPEIVNGKRSGPWYTQDAEEAANYAKRFGDRADVREYAIPRGRFLEASQPYSGRLAHDVASIIDTDYYGKQGAALARELRTYGPTEGLTGGQLWQSLERAFGNDGAAEVVEKLRAFNGVKGITHGPEAYVFKTSPVRDAMKAKFDPEQYAKDDIYGFATVPMLGTLAGGSLLGGWLAGNRGGPNR